MMLSSYAWIYVCYCLILASIHIWYITSETSASCTKNTHRPLNKWLHKQMDIPCWSTWHPFQPQFVIEYDLSSKLLPGNITANISIFSCVLPPKSQKGRWKLSPTPHQYCRSDAQSLQGLIIVENVYFTLEIRICDKNQPNSYFERMFRICVLTVYVDVYCSKLFWKANKSN